MRYYVNINAQANGDHEVHKLGCTWMPDDENKKYLGDFDYCWQAVNESRKYYNQTNGCYYCANACHTQ